MRNSDMTQENKIKSKASIENMKLLITDLYSIKYVLANGGSLRVRGKNMQCTN